MSVDIHESWKKPLSDEFKKLYFQEIRVFLSQEIEAGKIIYPHPKNIFSAFNTTPFDTVQVVILGQDPYHGPGQAHGLSFSVQDGVKFPPSLRNIFKEIDNEGVGVAFSERVSGNLNSWSEQGVLLLNSILTVEASKPASHSKIGWERFTDHVIQKISEEKEGVVFLLWGNFARGKKVFIDTNKHFVLESPHPSPFSAHNGFFGNNHFQKTNKILQEQGKKEIKW